MALDFKSGGFGCRQRRGRQFEKSRDGNERVQRDVMLHVTQVVNNQKVVRTFNVTEVEFGCPGKVENHSGCCLGKTGCWNKVQQDFVWFNDDDRM